MTDTLLDARGVGLAAPQVGVLRRVCVVLDEDDEVIELVNPEIIFTERRADGTGGLPERTGQIRRGYPARTWCGSEPRTETVTSLRWRGTS